MRIPVPNCAPGEVRPLTEATTVHASAPLRGFEPRTDELTARCSAIELERIVGYLSVTSRRLTASNTFGRFFGALPFLRSVVVFWGVGAEPFPFAIFPSYYIVFVIQ
jgi:hypothetical protein